MGSLFFIVTPNKILDKTLSWACDLPKESFFMNVSWLCLTWWLYIAYSSIKIWWSTQPNTARKPLISDQQQVVSPGARFAIFHEECDSAAVCLKQQREPGRPWCNSLKRAISSKWGQNTWSWLLSPLTPGGPFLFSFSSSLSPPLSQSLSLPSAPPHSLFMSAWIAPFHYNQLPAHYQSHNCFNNRSPSPSLCFHFHDNPWWRGGRGLDLIDPWFYLWVSVRLNWPLERASATPPLSSWRKVFSSSKHEKELKFILCFWRKMLHVTLSEKRGEIRTFRTLSLAAYQMFQYLIVVNNWRLLIAFCIWHTRRNIQYVWVQTEQR